MVTEIMWHLQYLKNLKGSEYMYGEAKITLKNGKTYVFDANNEDAISDFLYGIVGDSAEEELSGVPTFIEASSWCPIASVGEVFERNDFTIEITE